MNCFKSSILILSVVAATPVTAIQLEQAQSVQNKTNRASVKSQQLIDQSDSAAATLKSSIEQLNTEIRNLNIYRDHLKALVQSQTDEAESLNQQIRDIKTTRQGIIPLMYQMIDGLETLIVQDKPIKLAQREKRVAKLSALMGQADVSEAEKYRRILEAYQIEMDYGNKMATYQDDIVVNDQPPIEVDILYVGRLTLVARSLNHQRFWSWDQQSRQWLEGDVSHLSEINQAYNLANQQIAPTLLNVPVSLAVKGAK